MAPQDDTADQTTLNIILLLLRIGLSFAFFYAAIAAYLDPSSWIGYFPQFIRTLAPSETLLLTGFGIFEFVLGAWILSGVKIFIPSVIAALSLAGIVIFNWPQMAIVFRDISIVCMALALAAGSYRPKQ